MQVGSIAPCAGTRHEGTSASRDLTHPGAYGRVDREYSARMPALGDDPPMWDVLPNPNRDEGIDHYRPPASDRLDPVVLVGRADGGSEKATQVLRAVFLALLLGAPLASLGPRSVGWYVATGAMMITIVLGRLVLVLRQPPTYRPELTASSEGLTVTDIHGISRRTPWSDVGNLYLGWYSPRAERNTLLRWYTPREVRELYVTWVGQNGEQVVNNLGDSLDLADVRSALAARAPETVNLRLGPQRAHGST